MNIKFINFCIKNATKYSNIAKKEEKNTTEILFYLKIKSAIYPRISKYKLYIPISETQNIYFMEKISNDKDLNHFLSEQIYYFKKKKREDVSLFFKELFIINCKINEKFIVRDLLHLLYCFNNNNKIITLNNNKITVLRSFYNIDFKKNLNLKGGL